MPTDRIGMILIERGLLTEAQVQQIVARQVYDHRPFSTIAAEMFDLNEQDIWHTCAHQIRDECSHVRLCQEQFDPNSLRVISAKQAWDALVLPLRTEAGELVCATTEETLPEAISLMQQEAYCNVRFVITEIRPLEDFIAERYAYEGVELTE